MTDWVDSVEAAAIIGCNKSNLYNIVHKCRHDHIIKRKKKRNEHGVYMLYNRNDCEIIGQKRRNRRRRSDGTLRKEAGVEPSMFHPAMLKPWTPDGLRGITQ